MSPAWKHAERRVAVILEGKRIPLSGASAYTAKGDVELPGIFIEVKYRKRHTVFTLWNDVKAVALKERKEPVLVLAQRGGHIRLAVTDLAMLAKLLKNQKEETP